jgi:hypothetical protein
VWCKKSGDIARIWYGDNDKWTLSELLLDIEKTTDETQICRPHNEVKAKKSKEVGASKQEWVQCDKCEKWRRVSPQIPDLCRRLAGCLVLQHEYLGHESSIVYCPQRQVKKGNLKAA